MAVYKVIQDIEAEDKLLGPLTLKSFIYAMIAAALAFICVRTAISTTLGDTKWAIVILLFPFVLLFGILAAPIGKDQPTEVWILSHVRFFLGTHKKAWNQTGLAELVTINVPKKIEKHLTKEFTQDEVKGRLKALAATLDSRGWAVRNVNVDLYGQPQYFMGGGGDSDRLVGASTVVQPQQVVDIHASDDIMDEQNNATAQNFNSLMQQADAKRKKNMIDMFNKARGGEPISQPASVDYRFLDAHSVGTTGTDGATFVGTNLTVPTGDKAVTSDPLPSISLPKIELGDPSLRDKHPHFETKPSLAEEKAADAVSQQSSASVQDPATQQSTAAPNITSNQPQATSNSSSQSVKIELAKSDDIKVSSVAQLANHHETVRQISSNEVEISLH